VGGGGGGGGCGCGVGGSLGKKLGSSGMSNLVRMNGKGGSRGRDITASRLTQRFGGAILTGKGRKTGELEPPCRPQKAPASLERCRQQRAVHPARTRIIVLHPTRPRRHYLDFGRPSSTVSGSHGLQREAIGRQSRGLCSVRTRLAFRRRVRTRSEDRRPQRDGMPNIQHYYSTTTVLTSICQW